LAQINYADRRLSFGISSTDPVYNVSATAEIKFLGAALTWNQVLLDDVVTLTLTNGVVTKIDVTTHKVELTGTIKSATQASTGNYFILTVGTHDYTVDVPSAATISPNTETFSDLTPGKSVTVVGRQTVADEIVAATITIAQP
jgi:hypothetical protein